MTATNSSISGTVLLSMLCLGLAMVFMGGWYFQTLLGELKTQQENTANVLEQLKEKASKQLSKLSPLLDSLVRQLKVTRVTL